MGTFVAIVAIVVLACYIVGIFVWDYRRRKRGVPSIFVDACESEGHGKRLVREFRKAYKKQ